MQISTTKPKIGDPEDFNRSWQQLLATGRALLAMTHGNNWVRARQLRAKRLEMSRKHFAQFPVGPENKIRYQHRLSELFEMELSIDTVFAELADRAHTTSHLRLVK